MSGGAKVKPKRPTVDELRKLVRLDAETGKLYWKPRGPAGRSFDSVYAGKEAIGYQSGRRCTGHVGGRLVSRAVVVWALTRGAWPDAQVSHANGDTLDDRPENLRLARPARRARREVHSTGVKGVQKHKAKWRARIVRDGKLRHIGLFASREEAAQAVLAAEKATTRAG